MLKIACLFFILLLFITSSIFLFVSNIVLKKSISEIDQRKRIELNQRLSNEKETINNRLTEKYRNFMASYENIAKKLKEEKKKTEDLKNQDKLEENTAK